MKSILRPSVYLQLTAILLTHALPFSAAAEAQLPFRGSFQGAEAGEVEFPILFVDGSVAGTATHLGRFTMTYNSVVDLTNLAGSGSAELTAANGDRILTAVVGQAAPTEDPNVLSIVEIYVITGGTGRFAGASGSFVLERLLVDESITAGTFAGTIVLEKVK
jgi:hypothetical protein